MRIINPRLIATQALYRVIYQHESLSDVLADGSIQNSEDKALIQDMCFGSLRYFEMINAVLTQLLVKPLKQKDKDIECLLRIGLYQLIYQRMPDHAAVNETVAVTKKLKKKWSRGLVNGVLRSFLRDKDNIIKKANKTAKVALPKWLVKRIKQAWPEQWQDIISASNKKAPMSLRVNLTKTSRAAYIQQLQDVDIHATSVEHSQTAIQLEKPCNVYQLPHFDQGWVSVQDAAAQFAAQLLDCHKNMRVLDACAAPGGKTGHILETAERLEVVAVDNKMHRLERVEENLRRLNQKACCLCADVADTASWWDQQPFERILLDAPCSATGVIRRHPDIKLLRNHADIANLQQQQQRILTALWPLLATGGKLLYATCSILPEENTQQIANFLAHHQDAKIVHIDASWGIACQYGLQILSGQHHMDGFYYALLEKH
jgi:16S rRNA (cytosine967-C5)-methyltransferase